MSKFGLSKAQAILIGLSILATSVSSVFAENLPVTTSVKKPAELKNQVTQTRINAANIENKLADMREKLASKEAILRAKLQTFRDQKKATAAARISTNLNKINQNQTTQMQKHLNLMSTILDKLEARVNQLKPDVKDPTAAKLAIVSARAVIATASGAVSNQAQKDYTLQATTENRIKLDALAMRDKLHTDILALRKIVTDAKHAVSNAIRVAKSGSLINQEPKEKEKEGTISGQQ